MARARGPVVAKPQNDIYTGLLVIAFVAMLVSCVLLFLDFNQYGETAPKVTVPKGAAPPADVPQIGGGGSVTPAPAPAPAPMGENPPG
jgi:hypothetical protein